MPTLTPLKRNWGKVDKKNYKNSSTRARSTSLAPLTPDTSIGCDIIVGRRRRRRLPHRQRGKMKIPDPDERPRDIIIAPPPPRAWMSLHGAGHAPATSSSSSSCGGRRRRKKNGRGGIVGTRGCTPIYNIIYYILYTVLRAKRGARSWGQLTRLDGVGGGGYGWIAPYPFRLVRFLAGGGGPLGK